jgi:hypothetical protein
MWWMLVGLDLELEKWKLLNNHVWKIETNVRSFLESFDVLLKFCKDI